jgi:hypothetical protein
MEWEEKLAVLLKGFPQGGKAYVDANVDAVRCAVSGRGPDSATTDPHAGARMVCNIASVHIPAFVQASLADEAEPYKNGYDLGKFRLGDPPPGGVLTTREKVDRALPISSNNTPKDIYFGAVELNGTGIRFYGDVCLVLKDCAVDPKTIILDRNSYDLTRAPIRERIDSAKTEAQRDDARRAEAEEMAGNWNNDLSQIAAIKVLSAIPHRNRRLTTGTISDGVLSDEDYIEVLRIGSFRASDLQEARNNAAEAAQDALLSDRWRIGPCPSHESLVWQEQRRRAEEFLRCANVPVRIVMTSGRVRA